jgi:hypothetical protein
MTCERKVVADGVFQEALPVPATAQTAIGTFFWSPDSSGLAHVHDGLIDIWHWDD